MAHFAKLDQNNIVTTVNVVHDNELLVDGVENEQKGIDFLHNFFNTSDNWKLTSYHTRSGVHAEGGTPFRKNYAGIGYTYDAGRDAFIPPQPYPSWTLNETTCNWDPPSPRPNGAHEWDEPTAKWVVISS